MVEIRYFHNTKSFDLLIHLRENVRENNEPPSELSFGLGILTEHNILSHSNIGKQMIWSKHYNCRYTGVDFTMVHDLDYDFISFAVNNDKDRVMIAEHLRALVA